jgi:hypothetical protein
MSRRWIPPEVLEHHALAAPPQRPAVSSKAHVLLRCLSRSSARVPPRSPWRSGAAANATRAPSSASTRSAPARRPVRHSVRSCSASSRRLSRLRSPGDAFTSIRSRTESAPERCRANRRPGRSTASRLGTQARTSSAAAQAHATRGSRCTGCASPYARAEGIARSTPVLRSLAGALKLRVGPDGPAPTRRWESPALAGLSLLRLPLAVGYETGTVMVSETVESSKRVTVAVVNATSVTVAVHIGFGHDPGGAVGVSDVTVKRA